MFCSPTIVSDLAIDSAPIFLLLIWSFPHIMVVMFYLTSRKQMKQQFHLLSSLWTHFTKWYQYRIYIFSSSTSKIYKDLKKTALKLHALLYRKLKLINHKKKKNEMMKIKICINRYNKLKQKHIKIKPSSL